MAINKELPPCFDPHFSFIIPFDWDVKNSFRRPPLQGALSLQTCAVIRDGAADGELLVGKENDGEQQDDGDTRLRPPEHDDS